jgi:hypothetical protein
MAPDEAVGEAVAFVGRVAVELTAEFIFSRHGARYFHGIGRRVIAIVTFGRKRIPSSLRQVPAGMKPTPRSSDWLALVVGIGTFLAAIAGVIAGFLI